MRTSVEHNESGWSFTLSGVRPEYGVFAYESACRHLSMRAGGLSISDDGAEIRGERLASETLARETAEAARQGALAAIYAEQEDEV